MNVSVSQPLPYLLIGNRQVRYIYLNKDNKADIDKLQVSPVCHATQIVFLAADVLADSNILKANQPRIHSRFSKIGLATKVNFQPDIKLEGLHGISNGIWFYSIQGVFRVFFEFQDRTKQLHCVNNLMDLWKSSFADPVLPPSTSVHLQLSTMQVAPLQVAVHESATQEPEAFVESQMVPSCTAGVKTDDACIRDNSQQLLEVQEEKRSPDIKCIEESNMLTCSSSAAAIQSDLHTIAADGCSSDVNHVYTTLKTCLQHLQVSCTNAHQLQLVHVLHMLFQDYYQHDQLDKESFPFDLLYEFYLSHDGTTGSVCNTYEEDDHWSDEHQLALCIISKWLGKEFHKYGPSISTRVEQFKSKNIDRINDLPPAGQLVHALFPPSMHCLLVNWMGLSETGEMVQGTEAAESASDSPHEASVANYVTKAKRDESISRTFDQPRPSKIPKHQMVHSQDDEAQPEIVSHLYPLMQVILEFANQTLISGVAHVLYTRLIH